MNNGRSERSNVEDLLKEGAWVRALARRLVVDDSAADDVVQDTWVAAMRSAPVERERLRPWLARVVRNFATATRRTDANRAAREAQAARREPARSELETAERLEAQRALVDALEALAEPYRTTLMRRYFDGLSSADIALADGIPAATVRWRIAHGVEELRKRLDHRYGDRASWALAFLPLTRTPAPVALTAAGVGGVTTFGILAMSTATRATIAAIVLLTASVGVWVVVEGHEPLAPMQVASDGSATTLAAVPSSAASRARLALGSEAGERAEFPAETTPKPDASVTAADDSLHVEGRFVDANGRGIARVRVVQPVLNDAQSVESNDLGVFAFTVPVEGQGQGWTLEARAGGWATHFSKFTGTAGSTSHQGRIVLAPGGTITGKVIDEKGEPIDGARVLITKPALDGDPGRMARTGPIDQEDVPETKSGPDGSFELGGVPAELVRVWAWRDGSRWTWSAPIDVPPRDVVREVELKLVRLADNEIIAGVLLDPNGSPVQGEYVSAWFTTRSLSGSSGAFTGEDGRFRIVLMEPVPCDLTCQPRDKRWTDVALKGVEPGTSDVVLQLQNVRTRALLVWDDAGQPIDRFGFTVVSMDRRQPIMLGAEEAHANGHAEVTIPATPFWLDVWARGFTIVRVGPIDPAGLPMQIECILEHSAGLSGRVLDGEVPVAGAKVMLHRLVADDQRSEHNGFPTRLNSNVIETDATDAEGRFLVTVREPGTYALLCEAQGFALAEVSPLEADAETGRDDIEVHMSRGGTLEGRVLPPTGTEASGIVVGITRFDTAPRTQRVGADGRFRFEKLTPGGWSVERARYELEPGRSNSTSGPADEPVVYETNCVVEDGRVTTFDLDLRDKADAMLVGHVTVNGAPAVGWTVRLEPSVRGSFGNESPSVVVDARGDVRIKVPRPGTYRVMLLPVTGDAAALSMSRTITIHAGENPWVAALDCGSLEVTVAGSTEGLSLTCISSDKDGWFCQGRVACDEHGRFRVTYLPVGPVDLYMRGADRRSEHKIQIVRDRVTTLELP